MKDPELMTEVWRGPILESTHFGHAVICDASGATRHTWGNPDQVIYPRSSCKMVQALPLLESGAADAAGLGPEQLALACASHQGAPIHTDRVAAWLKTLDLGEPDLLCGPQTSQDAPTRDAMVQAGEEPCQLHNNCSGKHAGFLTLTRHLGAGPEYIDPTHPLQVAVKAAFEEATGEDSPGFGIDGCSAPNFATTVHGLARAMALFANARDDGDSRQRAAHRLTQAMIAHPDLVAGEGRACTELMRATTSPVAIKTGADGVFTAILPEQRLGIALKITDGATRGAECAIAALLVRLGVLDAEHPATLNRMNAPILSRRGLTAGIIKPAAALLT